eukprot:gene15222-biopygen6665
MDTPPANITRKAWDPLPIRHLWVTPPNPKGQPWERGGAGSPLAQTALEEGGTAGGGSGTALPLPEELAAHVAGRPEGASEWAAEGLRPRLELGCFLPAIFEDFTIFMKYHKAGEPEKDLPRLVISIGSAPGTFRTRHLGNFPVLPAAAPRRGARRRRCGREPHVARRRGGDRGRRRLRAPRRALPCWQLLLVTVVCGCCMWLLHVAAACGCCMWLLHVTAV